MGPSVRSLLLGPGEDEHDDDENEALRHPVEVEAIGEDEFASEVSDNVSGYLEASSNSLKAGPLHRLQLCPAVRNLAWDPTKNYTG